MEKGRSKHASPVFWIFFAALLSQNLVIPVLATTLEDQKHNHGSNGSPLRGSECNCSPPPTPRSPPPPTPRHGGGRNCETPPSPTRGGGSGYHSPPSGGSPPTPITISPPSGGSPPTPITVSPPTTPIVTPTTPEAPSTPATPGTSPPAPPFLPDPNTPITGTCNFWRTHPALVWGLVGWWATVGGAFGAASIPGSGAGLNVLDALSNSRSDGIGELYREGTASLLNSMANKKFHFSSSQVRDSFLAAVGSNKAAAAQARVFKLANEGRLKPRV